MDKQAIINAFKKQLHLRYKTIDSKDCLHFLEEKFKNEMDYNISIMLNTARNSWNSNG